MTHSVPTDIADQISQARAVIELHLASTLEAIHLYGSALDGGLKPFSDIDLLVTVSARPDEATRQALLLDLLTVSAPPGEDELLRALEVTVVVHNDVVPWPSCTKKVMPRRELQFGEWLREDLLAGIFEPAALDPDLAILLTQARQHSVVLVGFSAQELFDPVPEEDFFNVLADSPGQWNSPADWAGDERNILLTLARIWYSAATGKIVPKDVAADWLLERLPPEYQPVLSAARSDYSGHTTNALSEYSQSELSEQSGAFIRLAKLSIMDLFTALGK